jgi:CheY-like chemotaxis protein
MVAAIHTDQIEDEHTRYDDLVGVRVLVVDDDADTRELLGAILEDAGVLVACAGSVGEAFEKFMSHRPDVIISDIGMPGENGYSFIRNLRSVLDEDGGTTPAIALSGHALPEDRERGLLSGFNLYLTKPARAAALLRAVATLAGRESSTHAIAKPIGD